ncbi:type II secretion system protein GspM [Legionella dresdenensis]|uniref:Type II secretion system protein GspM n=1 Tax=Legionella dresdenensis TaxID=450200 RepID=A0ABV8CHG6_9GAMM
MMQYWANLNERDRVAAIVGVAVLIAYLFYLLVYSPLNNAVASKTKELQEKQVTYNWMQQVSTSTTTSRSLITTTNNKLLTVIASQLQAPAFQKFPNQLQQTSQGDIQLGFETVPYNQFLKWLWALGNQYAITVKTLAINNTGTPGLVKVTAVIGS